MKSILMVTSIECLWPLVYLLIFKNLCYTVTFMHDFSLLLYRILSSFDIWHFQGCLVITDEFLMVLWDMRSIVRTSSQAKVAHALTLGH